MKKSLLCLLFLIFSLSFSISAQDDDDIIAVDSSIVVMNATITDKAGKAVTGLKQSLFRVLEDGNEQEIVSFSAEETPFAAVILIDTSGSMEQRVSLARSAAIQFLDGLRIDDNASIYHFDSKVEMVQDFSNSRDLRDIFYDLKARGMTALNDAVFTAAEVLSKRPEKRRAIIVLSDGADTFSKKNSDKALQAALAANATIYTVDMSSINDNSRGRMQNQGALRNYAEKTGGQFVATPGGVAMRDAFKRIVEELGVQYTLSFQPSNTKKDGKWRALELVVAKPGLTIRTRKGYRAPKN